MSASNRWYLNVGEEGLLGVDLELEEGGSDGQRNLLGPRDVHVVDDVPDGLLKCDQNKFFGKFQLHKLTFLAHAIKTSCQANIKLIFFYFGSKYQI